MDTEKEAKNESKLEEPVKKAKKPFKETKL